MRYPFFFLFILFAMACGKDVQNTEGTPEGESEKTACDSAQFHFSVDVEGIAFTSDSCWITYIKDPSSVGLQSDFPAVIKWEYPGFPEWTGANSLSFSYNDEQLESSQDYQATDFIGVVEFDGTDGEMFQTLGDETLTIMMDEVNTEQGYACGTFTGAAQFTNYQAVQLSGSFKAILSPQ